MRRTPVVLMVALVGLGAACTDGPSRAGGAASRSAPPPATSRPAVPPHPSATPAAVAGDLAARWWTWAVATPADRNPVTDPDGRHCAEAQPADVWFLAGTLGGTVRRSCTVPAGRPVFLPVVNSVCPVPPGGDRAAAVRGCTGIADEATADLDGLPLPVRTLVAEGFQLKPAGANPMIVDTKAVTAVAWGHWVGPIVIAPGRHELHVRGQLGALNTEVTYDLTVR